VYIYELSRTFQLLGTNGQKGKIFGKIECPIPISVPGGKQNGTKNVIYLNQY